MDHSAFTRKQEMIVLGGFSGAASDQLLASPPLFTPPIFTTGRHIRCHRTRVS